MNDQPTIDYINGFAVAHFLSFVETDHEKHGIDAIHIAYNQAIDFCKEYGGKRFHNKKYGGGIAFPSQSGLMQAFHAASAADSK